MKKIIVSISISLLLLFTASAVFAEAENVSADKEPAFSVRRLVIAGSIENREPVGTVNIFPAVTEKVYCFLEARRIAEDTVAKFVWYHEDKQLDTIELPIKKSSRWRTYSAKTIRGRKGNWKVELLDAEDNVIDTAGFTVE